MVFVHKKGFTLVELMVVVAIIALISIVVVANVATARARSRDTVRAGDVKHLQEALQSYFSTNYTYPSSLSSLAPGILNSIPKDPKSKADYGYATSSSPLRFHVCATLESNTPKGKAGVAKFDANDGCDGTIGSVFDLTGGV